jgi:hypothetical protein
MSYMTWLGVPAGDSRCVSWAMFTSARIAWQRAPEQSRCAMGHKLSEFSPQLQEQIRKALNANPSSRVAPAAERKPNPGDEPLATPKRAGIDAGFCVVRITSFRLRLLDERNLWDKYVVDSLVQSGLLRDDSPAWCKIEVSQTQVMRREEERTEIHITYPNETR